MDYLDFIIAVDNAKEIIYRIDSFIRILGETLDKNDAYREDTILIWEEKRKKLCREFGLAIEQAINPDYAHDYPDVVRYIIAGLSRFYDQDGDEYIVENLGEFYDDLVGGRFD